MWALWTLAVALVAALAPSPALSVDYCSITCDKWWQSPPVVERHTMCLYPRAGLSSSCTLLADSNSKSRVTAQDQKVILDAHNKIRNQVRKGKYAQNGLPAAASLPALRWDAELATIAQRWAEQCVQGHDKCRNVKRFSVGQNAAWRWTSVSSEPQNWDADAVHGWFHGELPDFQQGTLKFSGGSDSVSGGVIGHLTQVIWAKTKLVGCGYAKTSDNGWTMHSYYCNYGPAGNMMGENIYERK